MTAFLTFFFYPVFDPDFCLCLIPLLCLLRWLISCVPNLSSVKTFCLLNWTVLSWHLGPDLVCQTLSQRICWPALSTAFVPGRAHTSTKAQQSPLKLVSPNPISNETQLFMVYYNLMWNQIKIKIIPNYGTLFFIKTHVLFPKKLTKLSESTLSHNVNENEKKKILDPHQKIMGSTLCPGPSSIQVIRKQFGSFCVILLKNQPTNRQTQVK